MGSIFIHESTRNSNYASIAEVLSMVCLYEFFHHVQDWVQLFFDFSD
ncbi:MAG: hypothetical protein AB2L20_26180 [Mangrovibacterium sp.]